MTPAASRHALYDVAAGFVLLGGAVHLQQWYRVFRDIDIGPTFLANAVVSIVVGALLIATTDRRVVGVGIGLSVGSLLALLASRTVGLLGFEATSLEAPEIVAIVVEVAATLALIACVRSTADHETA